MKQACVVLADGFEEVEAVTPIDYLRRAGMDVTVAGLDKLSVRGGHAIIITADCLLSAVQNRLFDVLVIPGGGKGAENIAASQLALKMLHAHHKAGKHVAAICAAPALVLGKAAGLLEKRRYSCYPGLQKEVNGGNYTGDATTVDGTIITAAAAGCAEAFALRIIEQVLDTETADRLKAAILA